MATRRSTRRRSAPAKSPARSTAKIPSVLIPDGSIFNMRLLQEALGLKSEESTKHWVCRHGIKPVVGGRNWLFSGRLFREAIEAYHERQQQEKQQRGGDV